MSKFQKIEFFEKSKHSYNLLPLRFTPLDKDRYVVTNLAGEFVVAARDTVHKLLQHELSGDDPEYINLRARHFLSDATASVARDLLAMKMRTKYERLAQFTCLHMFVVTLRCEHSCPYCQVSRQSEDKSAYDMSEEIAIAAIQLAFRSPSTQIKIEFQGGEPLLNFELIRFIVLECKRQNERFKKDLAFVVATNLALVDEDILRFCEEHDILISTSLDGPRDLHNKNRPRPGNDSYERTVAGIRMARRALGRDRVSALMTTTGRSLERPKEIVDEYLAQEFGEIFLRPLSPYGFAVKTKAVRAYDVARWLEFYKTGLEYIIDLNRSGISFREYYASLVLRKMLTSEDPGYVDLMSPAGIGIAAVVYNYNGDVYASDEGRMLAEMNDSSFRLGHVLGDSYEQIFTSPALLEPLEDSFAYSAPMCNDCAFEPYCGADPVLHHALYKDPLGRKPESEFCVRNMEIFRYLIRRMDEDRYVRRLFREWVAH